MATLTGTLRDELRAYAQEFTINRMESGLYNTHVALEVMSRRAGQNGTFGRAGVATALGSNIPGAGVLNSTIPNFEAQPAFQTERVSGYTTRGYRGQTGFTSDVQLDKTKKAGFRYTHSTQPVPIWKDDLRFNVGSNIRNVTEDAISAAMENMLDSIAEEFWTGNPADQDEVKWNTQLSFQQACATDNTYGRVDRTAFTAWAGNTVTAATPATLEGIVDEANITQGARLNNSFGGIDLVLTGPAIYRSLKNQALSLGAVRNIGDFPPDMEQIGQRYEMFSYGNTIIAVDPKAPANHVAALTTRSWRFESHPEANLLVLPFADGEEAPGSNPDALTSHIVWMHRFYTVAPWANVYFTNVSA